jgi:hypothetical protein
MVHEVETAPGAARRKAPGGNASRLLFTMARPVVPFRDTRNLWRSFIRGVSPSPVGKQKDVYMRRSPFWSANSAAAQFVV